MTIRLRFLFLKLTQKSDVESNLVLSKKGRLLICQIPSSILLIPIKNNYETNSVYITTCGYCNL